MIRGGGMANGEQKLKMTIKGEMKRREKKKRGKKGLKNASPRPTQTYSSKKNMNLKREGGGK